MSVCRVALQFACSKGYGNVHRESYAGASAVVNYWTRSAAVEEMELQSTGRSKNGLETHQLIRETKMNWRTELD